MLFPTTSLKYGTTLRNDSQKKEELFCTYYPPVTLKFTLSVPQYKYFSSFQNAERVLKNGAVFLCINWVRRCHFYTAALQIWLKPEAQCCAPWDISDPHAAFSTLLFPNRVHYEWTGGKCVNKNGKGCREFINSDHLISCKLKCMNSILLNTRINLKNLYWLNSHWYALE